MIGCVPVFGMLLKFIPDVSIYTFDFQGYFSPTISRLGVKQEIIVSPTWLEGFLPRRVYPIILAIEVIFFDKMCLQQLIRLLTTQSSLNRLRIFSIAPLYQYRNKVNRVIILSLLTHL